ncbi:hypothetical protein [Oceanobacillus locisalsi]|uniref:Uncharacterized protein n=1 Tax=Oceanobacillus locisalsi TaxID=546107 RepID=A0ABW3ND24_9BACI
MYLTARKNVKYRLFDGKTQGTPYHKYILAIACLFESRFPEKVLVRGDITIDQMHDAIEWANTILNKPVQLTERADSEKLLKRIRKIAWNEYDALTFFMDLNMQGVDVALGELVRREFSDDIITACFTEKFKKSGMRTAYFDISLSHFFSMGFSVEKACEICVLNQDGCQHNAQEFAEMIYTKFGKLIIPSDGFQKSMIQNLSPKEVVNKLENTLGGLVDLETIKTSVQKEADRAKAEQEESDRIKAEKEESD